MLFPKEEELIKLTPIPHVQVIYNVFGRKRTLVRAKPRCNKGDYLLKMNCLRAAKHSAAIFLPQTRRSRSTSEMGENTVEKARSDSHASLTRTTFFKNKVCDTVYGWKYTHARTHTSWQWTLIWDHDKHAADGACRERVSGRETDR